MGRVSSLDMSEQISLEEYNPIELIKIKFLELKDSPIGKYFFLYFLHLNGILTYKEEKDQCVYSKGETIFIVPLPIIDTAEKYRELERVHRNLEKFFVYLKARVQDFEKLEIQLLDI